MPLTPEDVSNKRFTPVRLREGYDMGEVDQFLDEVEGELTRLTRENEELRGKSPAVGSASAPSPAAETAPSVDAEDDETPAPAAVESAPAAPPVETIKVATVAEASSAATRLLEIATRSADELVDGAKAEAEQILEAARTDAERLESDARARSQAIESETDDRRQKLFGDLERDKEQLNVEVENLRSFEREYRARLKSYFEQQLASLNGSDGDAAPGDATAPRRLTSLLTEDEETS